MYSNFRDQGLEYAKQAVEEENVGNYGKAFPLYMNALEYLKAALKYEKDPNVKESISQKFTLYLRRAEEIRALLDHGGDAAPHLNSSATAAISSEKTVDSKYKEFSPHSFNYSKDQAIKMVKEAVQEDNAGNYAKAFPIYMEALENFKTVLKYEKNPEIKEAITLKFNQYLCRAEEISALFGDGGLPGTSSSGYGVDPEHAKMLTDLHYVIIKKKPDVKWIDVAGLESAKQALQQAAILPLKFPQFFTGKRVPSRAFLLYGPPGTGKSYLAKAIATEADSTFFSISCSDLVSKWMGETEKLVIVLSKLFQMACDSAPSIILIDEIDSLCSRGGEGNENEAFRRIKTELLVQMQGVGHNDNKVLVLATTNTPYALDQAIRRQFDKRIYIPLPDSNARQHIFKVHLGDTPNNLTEGDFESLTLRTEGFSGSDISVCVKDVLSQCVRNTRDAVFFHKTSDGMWETCGSKQPGAVEITMKELAAKGFASKILPNTISKTGFDKVLARQTATVSKSDVEVHERFTKEFGEKG
uniref:Protein SUPPRESSOR OF K(+) TRANSPORT GROWTH DEFECT 1 n=2 Tax=Cucumis melo TaxID=3656 RepID=A0A9I9DNV4_CUCME